MSDDHLSVPAHVGRGTQERVAGCGARAKEPSKRHSVARNQIAACWMPPESLAQPTIVRPSPLTPSAVRPPAKTTPVVGIQ